MGIFLPLASSTNHAIWLLAEAEQKLSPLQQMAPNVRARVLAALAGMIILGFAMMLLTWLGARFVRRYMNGYSSEPAKPQRLSATEADDWAKPPTAANQIGDSDVSANVSDDCDEQ